jgi:hypothetical protein
MIIIFQFPLPLREGIKGRGKLHPEIQSFIAPTLTLPREGGGNFRLLTRASNNDKSKQEEKWKKS